MVTILQVFYSVFSGLLLSLAIPNEFFLLGLPAVTLFSLIPFYMAIRTTKNYKSVFLLSFIQVVSTHLASSFWLAYFKDFAALTLGASAVGTGLIGAGVSLLYHLPYAEQKSRNQLNQNSFFQTFTDSTVFRIFYFAAVYTLYEWVKSTGFLGYPWGTISSAMFKWPVIMQLSAITGIYGISFIFALINAFFAECLIYYFSADKQLKQNTRTDLFITFKITSIFVALILVYGFFQYTKERIPTKTINTIIVQQNNDSWNERNDKQNVLVNEILTQEAYEKMQNAGETPQLILWCEGTLKHYLPQNLDRYQRFPKEKPLNQFIEEMNVPLITGGVWCQDEEKNVFFNAAIVFDNKGNLRGAYGKNHLVPCAEAIPGMEYPAVRKFMKKVIHISNGWTPGDKYVFFDVPCSYYGKPIPEATAYYDLSVPYNAAQQAAQSLPTVRISTPVCFDDCFPDIMRPLFLNGSEVFMNITNDSWSLKQSSEYQHFVNSVYSAIEYRTTLVRSTNAGYSVVVNPAGKVLMDMPLFEQCSDWYKVPIFERTMTTFARFGNWLPHALFALVMAYCVYMTVTFAPSDYIPSERKIKNKKHKKHGKKNK